MLFLIRPCGQRSLQILPNGSVLVVTVLFWRFVMPSRQNEASCHL